MTMDNVTDAGPEQPEPLAGAVLSASHEQLVLVCDRRFQVVEANQRAEDLLGYVPGGMLGLTVDRVLVLPAGTDATTALSGAGWLRPDRGVPAELSRADRRRLPVSLCAEVITAGHGQVIGLVLVAGIAVVPCDGGRPQHADGALLPTHSVPPELSHELRTPLTSVLGYVEMLLDEEADPVTPRQRYLLQAVLRGAHRLQYVVESLRVVGSEAR
jgi:nitrogen-specific signal transduction histidine kinase